MQSQISYLTAILSAGLLQKTVPETDFSKADWNVLMPFVDSNHLYAITVKAFSVYRDKCAGMPPREVFMKYFSENVEKGSESMKRSAAMRKLSKEWYANGKCPLALGGEVFTVFYPKSQMRGGSEYVCIPLYQKASEDAAPRGGDDSVEMENNVAATITIDNLTVTIPVSAVGPFGGRRGNEADAILRSAFYSAPCTMEPGLGIAYPAPIFLALYHLFTAQQLFINGVRLPFDMVVDWAMMLHALASYGPEKFDWNDFLEKAADLGILAFVQSFTTLAVRLTSVALPEGAASLTASDEDVDYLLNCLLDANSSADVTEGRFSRFLGVLRNSKKYNRFSASSPLREAFHYLFK